MGSFKMITGEETGVPMNEIKVKNWLPNLLLDLCCTVGILVAVVIFWNVGGIICNWWIANGLAFLALLTSTMSMHNRNEGSTSSLIISLFGWTLSTVFAPRLFVTIYILMFSSFIFIKRDELEKVAGHMESELKGSIKQDDWPFLVMIMKLVAKTIGML
eukprot:TRINITY_DN25887_c0_g1_i1.p1 TRINITY_DN25887_c0_g1~~TRINITY_DN25887_c0_g1_i1.p1  ORF type:complete len:167 (-),score=34.59 TRINITY_DN25887_c0_g1_i1:2-478(-)